MTDSQFAVVTDGGLDAFTGLNNDVPVAPFSVTFGNDTYAMHELPREELMARILAGNPHPSTSQPTPQAWLEGYRQAAAQGAQQIVALTISPGLSGSANAAEQARTLLEQELPGVQVQLFNSGSLSAAQAFVLHALMTAAGRGESVETALQWAEQVRDETELYFTIETLDFLQKGGRIGKVAATLGGLLNLKPVVTVEKPAGIYTTAARARGYKGGIREIAAQLTRRYGEGTPLRAGLLYGSHPEDAEALREQIAASHPLVWAEYAPVNGSLMVHTGPRAVGAAAAPGAWPWER
ncbi:DegV domain-containing protein [Deinococcus piscis]|uniref:DegV domain-containing protein n=1 Tax=Deinococcus piscis TaxID=394230 RepID=A0ABQ3K2Y5_9DEIO|nr:DegV family protein [Deinococcus piscis]GHF99909.1 DegV domain-containing protein [Deinococcus piscis]